jgi:hypothetical protein
MKKVNPAQKKIVWQKLLCTPAEQSLGKKSFACLVARWGGKQDQKSFAASSRPDMCHHTQPGTTLDSPPTIVSENDDSGAAGLRWCAVLVSILTAAIASSSSSSIT